MKRALLFSILLLSALSHSTLTYANEASILELRKGVVICDADPTTNLKSVILPAIWTKVTEIVVLHEAQAEPVYTPASFNLDGSLVHPARISERTLPALVKSVTRNVVLVPESVALIDADGRHMGGATTSEREAFYAQLTKFPELIVENPEEPWERIFREYVEQQHQLAARSRDNLKRISQPRIIAPNLDWIHDFSSLNISEDEPISLLIEPTAFSYPTEDEVVAQWENYAARIANQNAFSKLECEGSRVIEKSTPPSIKGKAYKDIGVKVPRIKSIGKIRKFNIYGAELE